MTKVIQIMTVPEVRHRLARQLGMLGIAIGMAGIVLLSALATLS